MIRYRRQKANPPAVKPAFQFLHIRLHAGVYREQHWHRYPAHLFHGLKQRKCVIFFAFSSVHGKKQVFFREHPVPAENSLVFSRFPQGSHRMRHTGNGKVAGIHRFFSQPFFGCLFNRFSGRAKQQLGQMIRHHTILFFAHIRTPTTQARFYMHQKKAAPCGA